MSGAHDDIRRAVRDELAKNDLPEPTTGPEVGIFNLMVRVAGNMLEDARGAAADCAATAGAQVAREQATDRAEVSVAELQQTIRDQAAIIEDYQQSIAELGADPDQEAVERGAGAIFDLLTMLGVTPDERPEHGGPTTAEVLAAAVLGVRHSPVEVPNA